MYPLIGIIMRSDFSKSGHRIDYTYSDIEVSIIKSGGIPMSILAAEIDKFIPICDGFILEGGDNFTKEDFICLDKIYDANKALLGICLGMQEMAYLNGGVIKEIKGHKNKMHDVIIDKDSLLYRIIGKNKIKVNSRHKEAIMKTDAKISAKSTDNIIEAIEDGSRVFYLGLQWHPESMYNEDEEARKIFDYFIKVCHDNISTKE